MKRRLLITGAGSGASDNLIRSLRAGDPSLFICGCHHDRFFLRKSSAERNYLLPPASQPGFPRALCRVVEAEKIDLVIPTGDEDVVLYSRLREEIPCHVFLPGREVIDLCQDKYRLSALLHDNALPVPLTYPVTSLESIEALFNRLPPGPRLWCRIRTGTDSIGATPVKNPDQARAWISYWEEMRGVPAKSFTLSEYLPGRAFSCQSLWKDGELILAKTFEHLSYFRGEARPSGVSSVTALAKTVFEPRVVEVSAAAIRTVDPSTSGTFDVDLKEDAHGIARITEINAGRFISGTNLFDLTGKHNMAVTYVRLALDEPVVIAEPYDVAEDYYMVRDLDALPGIFHADEFFDGIEDARG
jgi:predicted ATP-grasp superfamily ATP-dependent carboligase